MLVPINMPPIDHVPTHLANWLVCVTITQDVGLEAHLDFLCLTKV